MGFVDKLKQALGIDDNETEISWRDRLVTAVYISPSGTRISFDYEDVSVSFEKKGTAFEFSGGGTYVQDKGPTSFRIPMIIYFTGKDYDFKANIMMAALRETGRGQIEHPIYGTHEVVVFGNVDRVDALVSGANQAAITVTFWVSTGVLYPEAQEDARASLEAALAAFNGGSSEQFATQLDLSSAAEQAGFLENVNYLLDTAEGGLKKVAAVTQVVNDQFEAVVDSINRGIDVLIGQPLTLAFQVKIMLQGPARALASIKDKLAAYGDLARDIFDSPSAIALPGGIGGLGPGPGAGGIGSIQTGGTAGSSNDSQSPNKFHAEDLFATTLVSGSIVAALNHTFENATEALETAEAVIDQFRECIIWRDENYKSLSGENLTVAEQEEFIASPQSVDIGETYQTLQTITALCVGFLIQSTFSLQKERRVVLERNRSIVDLCGELYGDVDGKLDFFIRTNDFTGSEILELPRGKEVLYYV